MHTPFPIPLQWSCVTVAVCDHMALPSWLFGTDAGYAGGTLSLYALVGIAHRQRYLAASVSILGLGPESGFWLQLSVRTAVRVRVMIVLIVSYFIIVSTRAQEGLQA